MDPYIDGSANLWSDDSNHAWAVTDNTASLEQKPGINPHVTERMESLTFDDPVVKEPPLSTAIITDSIWDSGNQISHPFSEEDGDNAYNNETHTPQDKHNADLEQWLNRIRREYKPLSSDTIIVEEIPQKEGVLFKHTNYYVKHLIELPTAQQNKERTVIRRYSDFLWLQEVLHRRYPFRLIPELPPKKIGSQNLDPTFLSERRQGLTRFINLVAKHPILVRDDLVVTFLSVPTDLSSWRKQANYDTSDEFMDRKISKEFMSSIWKNEFAKEWNAAARNIEKMMGIWDRVALLIVRQAKRLENIASEQKVFGNLLSQLSNNTSHLYPVEYNSTVLEINNNLSITTKHIKALNELYTKHSEELSGDLLCKVKLYISMLRAFKALFERYQLMATNNIKQLQKHVKYNLDRLENMKGKPDASSIEYDKLKRIITKDKKSIYEQANRSWLIRECILEEFTAFQNTQYMITKITQGWVSTNSSATGLRLNEWESLANLIVEMPISNE